MKKSERSAADKKVAKKPKLTKKQLTERKAERARITLLRRSADQLLKHIFVRLERLTLAELLEELENEYEGEAKYEALLQLCADKSVSECIRRTLIPRYIKFGWLEFDHKATDHSKAKGATNAWRIKRSKTSCQHCLKEMKQYSRIDTYGNKYCSSYCYSDYMELARNILDDEDHPYFYDCEEMISLLSAHQSEFDRLKAKLGHRLSNLTIQDHHHVFDKASDLINKVDYSYTQFESYVYYGGDDGTFAYEIYKRTNQLQELMTEIKRWCLNQTVTFFEENFQSLMNECYDDVKREFGHDSYEDSLNRVHWRLCGELERLTQFFGYRPELQLHQLKLQLDGHYDGQAKTPLIPSYEEMIELEDTYGVGVARPETSGISLSEKLDRLRERIVVWKP
jgi:hypothetical protein